MDYNTRRNKLLMREYGRNVQTLVEKALAEEDREQRTKICHGIISLMERLNPSIRQEDDYRNKLWDHLHIIGDYSLDIESPYPVPDREVVESKPERLVYPQSKIRRKHYGKNLEALIERCATTEDPEKKEEFKKHIAGFMKMVYKNWHRDNVSDEQIVEDLKLLSDGRLELEEGVSIVPLDQIGGGGGGPRRNNKRSSGGRNSNRKTSNNNQRSRNSRGRGRGRRR